MSDKPYIPPGCDPESILLTFPVAREHAGLRLDRFIQNRIPRLSRTRAQQIVKATAYKQDGTRRRASERVKAGEVVLLVRPPMDEPQTPQEFGILYEDEDVVAIDKPAGLPMHPTATYHKNTLTWLMRKRWGEDDAPQFAHRLDRETSGVVICAKHREAERALKNAFETRRTRKRYVAIVRGAPPASGRIDVPLTGATEGLHILMGVAPEGTGLVASTEFEVLEQHEGLALMSLKPVTGRQHQLRVHVAHIGHPIIGDKLYGPEGHQPFLDYVDGGGMTSDLLARLGIARHALHAEHLVVPHPRTGEPLEIRSPMPEDMVTLLARGRQSSAG